MPQIYDRYQQLIITPKLQTFSLEKWVPYSAGNKDGEEFLPFNAYSLLSVLKHMWRPVPLEPLSLKITTEPHGARCISVEL